MVNPKNKEKFPSGETRTWSITEDTFPDYYKKGKIVFPGDYEFLSIKRPAFRVFEQEDKNKAVAKYGSDEVKMSVSTYLPPIDNGRNAKTNPLNANFDKKEFKELWNRINHKAAYVVDFETPELIKKCIAGLDKELKVNPLLVTIETGTQTDEVTDEALKAGTGFGKTGTKTDMLTNSIHSAVKYDLIGKLAEQTQLTRRTIASILQGISVDTFSNYPTNPEDFIAKASRLINEQKATIIVEHLAYDTIAETHRRTMYFFANSQPH